MVLIILILSPIKAEKDYAADKDAQIPDILYSRYVNTEERKWYTDGNNHQRRNKNRIEDPLLLGTSVIVMIRTPLVIFAFYLKF